MIKEMRMDRGEKHTAETPPPRMTYLKVFSAIDDDSEGREVRFGFLCDFLFVLVGV